MTFVEKGHIFNSGIVDGSTVGLNKYMTL